MVVTHPVISRIARPMPRCAPRSRTASETYGEMVAPAPCGTPEIVVPERMLFPLRVLPGSVLKILREAARHILKRPVIAVAAVPFLDDGRIVLIRRGDTGTWALPGGTLEWGETLRTGLARELLEEAGIHTFLSEPELVGVFSRPDRDVRFHGVSVIVRVRVAPPTYVPMNSLEILQVKAFYAGEVPRPLALGQNDMLDAALQKKLVFE